MLDKWYRIICVYMVDPCYITQPMHPPEIIEIPKTLNHGAPQVMPEKPILSASLNFKIRSGACQNQGSFDPSLGTPHTAERSEG